MLESLRFIDQCKCDLKCASLCVSEQNRLFVDLMNVYNEEQEETERRVCLCGEEQQITGYWMNWSMWNTLYNNDTLIITSVNSTNQKSNTTMNRLPHNTVIIDLLTVLLPTLLFCSLLFLFSIPFLFLSYSLF